MPSSSREEWVSPSSPKMEGVMTMVIFVPSSVESCGGGHGISSKEEEVCHSSPKEERGMTMVIFSFPQSRAVEVIPEEGVCPSSPKKAGSMPMAIILPSSVESCGGGHDISSRERGDLLFLLLGRRIG